MVLLVFQIRLNYGMSFQKKIDLYHRKIVSQLVISMQFETKKRNREEFFHLQKLWRILITSSLSMIGLKLKCTMDASLGTIEEMVSYKLQKKIDRFLVSQAWKISPFLFSVEILPFLGLDHFPILLSLDNKVDQQSLCYKSSFKFESMWFRNLMFLPLIRQWWVSAPQEKGNSMFRFYKKLQYLKGKIRVQNKQVFKNIFEEKNKVQQELQEINEEIISSSLNPISYSHQKEKQIQWANLCHREKDY